jgi:alkylation response protein AidB-like acyl-CoA dehydrogenase
VDFDDTPEEAEFRAHARAWLSANAKLRIAHDRHGVSQGAHVARSKEWQQTLFDQGWAGLTWPKKFGGRGIRHTLASIFNQEAGAFEVSSGVFTVGIGMVGPTLMAHGNEAQRERYLAPMLRGDEIWCQLFSEPGAGSDLAALGCRAVPDGDEWVVNGQKVWTSMGHFADYGVLLARTDPDAAKHRGITYFIVDMRTEGIDVRPLRQITGIAHFNEVFLNDVRIPSANIVGGVNHGWRVAHTTLNSERGAIGGSTIGPFFDDFVQLARETGADHDVMHRQGLASLFIRTELLRFLRLRVQSAMSSGEVPGAEASVMKLAYSRHWAQSADLVESMMGINGTLFDYADEHAGYWPRWFLGQWSVRLGGGTDEIQRNVMGERVLGLPREPDLSKDIPWRDLPKG